MKDSLRSVSARNALRSILAIGASAILLPAVHAADVSMTSSNGFNANGFTGTAGWPEGLAPVANPDAAITDYFTGAFGLRNEQAAGNAGYEATFAGKSLTISAGGVFVNKGGEGTILNIADFRIDGGSWSHAASGGPNTTTLRGALTVGDLGATFEGDSGNSPRYTVMEMNIGGTGPILIRNSTPTNDVGGRTLTNALRVTYAGANTYTGNTTIGYADPLLRWAYLVVNADSSIGDVTANSSVNVLATGLVAFNSINNMGAGQTLVLDSNLALLQHIELNYAGEMLIGALSLDGGATFEGEGTYGAIGSDATFQSDYFTGTGLLTVVPEPSTVALVTCGLAAGGFLLRRRRIS
jgi:hypothetical protein